MDTRGVLLLTLSEKVEDSLARKRGCVQFGAVASRVHQ